MAPERAVIGEALYHISSRDCQVLLQPDCGPTLLAGGIHRRGGAGLGARMGRRRRFPGNGAQQRVPRPATVVETDLPPIAVDFRDLAEQAGLTSPVVSGRDDRSSTSSKPPAPASPSSISITTVWRTCSSPARRLWMRRGRREFHEPPLSQPGPASIRRRHQQGETRSRRLGPGRLRRRLRQRFPSRPVRYALRPERALSQ